MSGRTKVLARFWQELKRRKVIKTIMMYAGGAYVLIELVSNVAGALNLPDWSQRMLLIILLIGFPVIAILSWIFDLTPEGIKKTGDIEETTEGDSDRQTARRKLRVSDFIIVILLIAVCILLYPKIFGADKFESIRDEDGRISIAVMPFENLTGDSELNYLGQGISSLIINGLGSSKELAVRDDHTMHEVISGMDPVLSAGLTPSLARKAASLAQAETYISGSYQGSGDKYLILTNLVDTESGDLIWSHKTEGKLTSETYLDLGNSLCNDIRNYLEVEALKEDVDYDFREAYTSSPEAYKYYIEGMNLILAGDYSLAIESMNQALEIDSSFAFAAFYIAWSRCYGELLEPIDIWTAKAYEMKDQLPMHYRNLVSMWHACFNLKDGEKINKYCDLLSRSDNKSRLFWFDVGVTYGDMLNEFEKSIQAFEKVEEIERERGHKWNYFDYYKFYIRSLHEAGEYEKAKEISDQGLAIFPDHAWLTRKRLSNAMQRSDSSEIREFSERLEQLRVEQGWTDAYYENQLSFIYWGAGQYNEAELHAKKAHELEPESKDYNRMLSWLQVMYDLNVEEGTRLVMELLEVETNVVWTYWIAATGFRKMGQPEEALKITERGEFQDIGFVIELDEEIKLIKSILAEK